MAIGQEQKDKEGSNNNHHSSDEQIKSIKERIEIEDQKCQILREKSKFLSLFSEQSASARLCLKENQVLHMTNIADRVKEEAKLMSRIHGNRQTKDGEEKKEHGEEVKRFSFDSNPREKLLSMPHIASAFGTISGDAQNQATNGRENQASNNNVASIKDKFNNISGV